MGRGFYLKLTQEEAETMISDGISALFGGLVSIFENYTQYIIDHNTGDIYWHVENVQHDGVFYDCEGWITNNYPELTQYSESYVKQFVIDE